MTRKPITEHFTTPHTATPPTWPPHPAGQEITVFCNIANSQNALSRFLMESRLSISFSALSAFPGSACLGLPLKFACTLQHLPTIKICFYKNMVWVLSGLAGWREWWFCRLWHGVIPFLHDPIIASPYVPEAFFPRDLDLRMHSGHWEENKCRLVSIIGHNRMKTYTTTPRWLLPIWRVFICFNVILTISWG